MKDYNLVNESSNKLHTSIESQHYIAQSRLLDVSFNCLNSLFFLASKDNTMDEDGILYVFGFPSYFSPNDDDIKQLFINSINRNSFVIDKNFKVLTNCWLNDRIKSQKGGFILFLGDSPFDIPEIYYEKVIIKKDDYAKLREELFDLYGLNKFSLFPEIDSFKDIIKAKKIEKTYEITISGQINEFLDRLDLELSIDYKKGMSSNFILRKIANEKKYLYNLLDCYKRTNKNKESIVQQIEEIIKEIDSYLSYEKSRFGGLK